MRFAMLRLGRIAIVGDAKVMMMGRLSYPIKVVIYIAVLTGTDKVMIVATSIYKENSKGVNVQAFPVHSPLLDTQPARRTTRLFRQQHRQVPWSPSTFL